MANTTPEVTARLCCETCGRPYEEFLEKHGISLMLGSVRRDEAQIIVTNREWQIIETLLRRFPNAVHKETIFLRVWGGSSDVQIKTLGVFICKLRKKIGPIGLHIETLFGMGYQLHIRPMLNA